MSNLQGKTDFLTKGKIVYVYEGIGVVRYVNPASLLVGIELAYQQDNGITTDGVLNSQKYFKCRPKCGIFVYIKEVLRIIQPEELLREIIKLRQLMSRKQANHVKLRNEMQKIRKENEHLKRVITLKSQQQQTPTNIIQNNNNSSNNNGNNIININNINTIMSNHVSQNSILSSKSHGSLTSTPIKGNNASMKTSFSYPNTNNNIQGIKLAPTVSTNNTPYQGGDNDLEIGDEISHDILSNESITQIPEAKPTLPQHHSMHTINTNTSLPSLPAFSRFNSIDEDDEKRLRPKHTKNDHTVSELNGLQVDGIIGSVRNLHIKNNASRTPISPLQQINETNDNNDDDTHIITKAKFSSNHMSQYNPNMNMNTHDMGTHIGIHNKKISMVSTISNNSLYSYHESFHTHSQSRKSVSDEEIDNNEHMHDHILNSNKLNTPVTPGAMVTPIIDNNDDLDISDMTHLSNTKSDFLKAYDDHLYGQNHSASKIEARGRLLFKGLTTYLKKKSEIQEELQRQENELKIKRLKRKQERQQMIKDLDNKRKARNNNINKTSKKNINKKKLIDQHSDDLNKTNKYRNSQTELINQLTHKLNQVRTSDVVNNGIFNRCSTSVSISAPASPANKSKAHTNIQVNAPPIPLTLEDSKSKRTARLSKWLTAMDKRLADLEKQGKWKPVKTQIQPNEVNMLTPTNDYIYKKYNSLGDNNNAFAYNFSGNNNAYVNNKNINETSYKEDLSQLKIFNEYWGPNNRLKLSRNRKSIDDYDDNNISDDAVHELVSMKRNQRPRKSLSTPVSPKTNLKFGKKKIEVVHMDTLSPITAYNFDFKKHINSNNNNDSSNANNMKVNMDDYDNTSNNIVGKPVAMIKTPLTPYSLNNNSEMYTNSINDVDNDDTSTNNDYITNDNENDYDNDDYDDDMDDDTDEDNTYEYEQESVKHTTHNAFRKKYRKNRFINAYNANANVGNNYGKHLYSHSRKDKNFKKNNKSTILGSFDV